MCFNFIKFIFVIRFLHISWSFALLSFSTWNSHHQNDWFKGTRCFALLFISINTNIFMQWKNCTEDMSIILKPLSNQMLLCFSFASFFSSSIHVSVCLFVFFICKLKCCECVSSCVQCSKLNHVLKWLNHSFIQLIRVVRSFVCLVRSVGESVCCIWLFYFNTT